MLFRSNDTAYEILFSDWSSDVCSSDLYLTVAGDTSLYTVDGSTVQTILAADAAEADS